MSHGPRHPSYEVAVVGGGVVGLACAWRARQQGLSTVLLERERAGAGASGVAAGMLAPVTEADFGEQSLLGLNLAGLRRWAPFAAELSERSGLEPEYRESGALVVAADRDDAEELRRLADLQASLGLDADWLSGRECRRLEPGLSPRVPGGIEAPREAHVDPGATVEALRAAFLAAGGELLEGVGVEEVRLDATGSRVAGLALGNEQSVEVEQMVGAAGTWSGLLEGLPSEVVPPVRPVKGQILTLRATEGRAPLAGRLVRTPRCYLVTRRDGRVVVGATTEERGFDVRVTAEGVFRLLEAAREVLPDVDELDFVAARAGLRPVTPDNAPVVGRTEIDGLLWATGHGRNGVLLAPITAEAIAACLSGEDAPEAVLPFSLDRFAPNRPPVATAAALGER